MIFINSETCLAQHKAQLEGRCEIFGINNAKIPCRISRHQILMPRYDENMQEREGLSLASHQVQPSHLEQISDKRILEQWRASHHLPCILWLNPTNTTGIITFAEQRDTRYIASQIEVHIQSQKTK